jgi:hypothetical protein
VKSRREFSPQTLSVLAALFQEPSRWQHGYALAARAGRQPAGWPAAGAGPRARGAGQPIGRAAAAPAVR